MTSTFQRLQLFRDRVYSAYCFGHRRNNHISTDGANNDDNYNFDDAMPLFQVIKAVQRLITKNEGAIDDEWTHSFLRRVERTVCGMPDKIMCMGEPESDDFLNEQYFIKPWKLYLDESQFILADWEYGPDDDSVIWTRHGHVCEFENELERRKNKVESMHGQRKTLCELCKKHRVCLAQYLAKCISFHSSIPIQGLSTGHDNRENVNHVNREETEKGKRKSSTLRTIEVPLRLSSSRLSESLLSSSNADEQEETVVPFIPSLKETFVKSTGSFCGCHVGEALETHRWTVILGDPGCGKTTLLRWLMLEYARLLARTNRALISLERRLDKWQRLAIRFGQSKVVFTGCSMRLPILIRVGELVEWLDLHPTATIMNYIGHQTWFTVPYVEDEQGSFLREFIHHGHAFLLFDGLDEVSNHDERRKIVHLIETFVEEYVRTPAHISVNEEKELVDEWGGLRCEWPKFVGGSQVIITSRIIGYYLYPIRASLFTLSTLDAMDEKESRAFVNHWLLHIPYSIVCDMSSKTDRRMTRVTRKEKELQVKEALYHSDEKIWSHPMLLSLILPLLYKTTTDVTRLGPRILLYDMTVRFALDDWVRTCESLLDDEAIYWVLHDMACYIHTRCPSGLIDTFDLTHLFYISLRDLYKHKKISKSNRWLNNQAVEFVRMLKTNSIGFVVARGLDAYGFAHLTFQECFVALSIVKPRIDGAPFVLDRLIDHIMKPSFREPLILATEWINWTWKSEDFDAFCIEMSRKFIGPLPIGALFLSSVLGNLSNVPGLQVLSCLFTTLVSSSFDKRFSEYLAMELCKMEATSTLLEHLLQQNTNLEALCRFFAHSLVKDRSHQFAVPYWLSETHILKLEACTDTNDTVETMIDSVLRCVCNTNRSEKLQASNSFSNILVVRKPNIHPAMLSLLIVLCGGLYYTKQELRLSDFYENTPKSIQFDPSRMHRSTALSDILSSYFTDEAVSIPNRRLEQLIKQCHEIVSTASTNDESRRVVEAFIALICLRSFSELSFYEHLLQHRALPRALYRMRLALYQMRQFHCGNEKFLPGRSSLLPHAKHSKLEGCQILEKFLIDSKVDVPSATSFLVALSAAFSRLFSHSFLGNVLWDEPLPISLSENEKLLQNSSFCSAQALHLILNPCSKDTVDDAAKWRNSLHPFQIYCNHPLFSIAFISSRLQPLFERLVLSKKITNREILPFVVVLAEVLLSVEEILRKSCCEVPLRILLLLRVLENDIRECQLESYSEAIVHSLQTEENCNDWRFSECYRGMTVAHSEKVLELALNRERKRIFCVGSDMQLFAASIGLTRAVTSMRNECNETLEEAKVASLAISDPILRVLCLRHLREIVRSCVNTQYYYSVQEEIIAALENIPIDDMPLLTLALIFGSCAEEQLHPSMGRLLDFVWKRLQCVPTCDEERLDQEAVFLTIRRIIGHLYTPIPHFFLTRSALFQFNSPIFHTVFQNKTFSSTETILLAQLYLAEVTVDAQVLTQFTQETVSPPMNIPSLYAKNVLRHSWKPHCGKFSHRQVILINSLVLSSSIELEEIPFDKLRNCTGFEEKRDRPVVESWLKYYDDERRAQVAILAVFLLIRAEQDMTPTIRSMVELIFKEGLSSKVDSIRRGARACFTSSDQICWRMYYWEWSTSMWSLLRNLMIYSLGSHFALCGMTTVQRMNNLLEVERQRLTIPYADDLYPCFSLLSLIDKTFDNDGTDIQIHLSEIMVSGDHIQDMYLAFVIFHIVRQCQQKEWCDNLFKLLHNLLYNTNLPSARLAAVYTLVSQERGRKMLLNALNIHFDQYDSQTSDERKCLSEPELVACLIALTNRNNEMTNNNSLCPLLWQFWSSVKSESIHVQRHFQACFFSHINNENGRALSNLRSLFELTIRDVYTLYIINTSYFVLEWRECEYWDEEAAKFIISSEHKLFAQFAVDFYACLSAENGANEFQNPKPNYLAIAGVLVRDYSDVFCQVIRASVFGEEKFKNALYLFNKRGATVDQRKVCIEIYASFRILTTNFIDMIFAISLDDFSSLQFYISLWYEKVDIANRDDIESIFLYLESASIHQRHLALRWLLRLVELDILSIHEVQQLLMDKDALKIANTDDECNDTAMWCRLMCLEPVYDREYFTALSPEEVEADFSEVLEVPSLQFT